VIIRLRISVALTAAVVLTAGHRSAAQPPLGGRPATARTVYPQVVSSGGGGVYVNDYLGATAFYAAGYTGSSAVAVNIEGQHAWNGHETLQNISQFITGPGALGSVGGHPTAVTYLIGGRPNAGSSTPVNQQRGMAYNTTLWSGAIATTVSGSSFDITFRSFYQPYLTAFQTGVGGVTADVSNGSWGDDVNASAGRTAEPRALDALASATGKVLVFAAGNSGSGANTVLAPASGYNVISVAALGSDTSSPPYNTPSGFSSRGPQDVFIPTGSANGTTGSTVSGGRIRVDIAAPGQDLLVAGTGSATAYGGGAGTSFAAPLVSGGVALMIDAGRTLNLSNYADIRVVKAVLMTSADKTAGWNNGQALSGGVIRTTQAVDTAVGAGRMNLAQALPFYADPASTRDVAGTTITSPVSVAARGYDYAAVVRTAQNDYRLPDSPSATRLAVTLTWLANRGISDFQVVTPTDADFFDNRLANLNLQVYRLNAAGDFDTLVAESASPYNNSEHLFLTDLAAGRYGLRVLYTNDVWNFTSSTDETYGLAWNQFVPVPEPAGILVVVVVATFTARSIRRKRATPDTRPSPGG
jgi:subtilisin family serine protease